MIWFGVDLEKIDWNIYNGQKELFLTNTCSNISKVSLKNHNLQTLSVDMRISRFKRMRCAILLPSFQ